MKIIKDVKISFVMEVRNRIDDNKALREALANCLINADYYGTRGVVIKKDQDRIIFENPGYIRTGKEQMRRGGESDSRNKTLMKMFDLINIGERSGSGVPNIFNTWNDQGWKEPVIEERFDPDRTILTLEFVDKTNKEKAAKKSGEEKTAKKKITNKTKEKMIKIKEYLSENKEAKTKDIAEYIGLKHSRTREILSQMDSVESIGTNTNRKYRLKDNQK